jgi:hypothetical protein
VSQIVAFARDELNLTLTPGQAEMVTEFEEGGYSEAVWKCGRRGGKSTLADVLALYDCIARDHLRGFLLPDEPRIAGIVAQNQERARRHIARCSSWVKRNPRLKRMLVKDETDELGFSNGSAIVAFPCSSRSLRGDAWSLAILDELAHFVDTTDGPASAQRIYEAAAPALAQFADAGWMISISTPGWQSGQFFKLVQQAQSGEYPAMHYASKTSREMNPRLSAAWLDKQRVKDPDLYRREYLAEFVAAGAFLDSLDVLACVRRGSGVLPPVQTNRYRGAIDPAFAQDNFSLGIAHVEGETVIVDGVWVWHRGGFEHTLDEVVAVAKRYRIDTLRTDQFSSQAVLEGLARRGLGCYPKPWDNMGKYEAFSRLKAGLATRQVQLPDDEGLTSELLTLEARPTRSGATFIGASGGAKDDRATVLAALMDMTSKALSPGDESRLRELLEDLRALGAGRSRFADATGVPGISRFGLENLN